MNSQSSPLVSVICLCYNHSQFVVEAMTSVLGQTYPHVELIVVDDASTDNSQQVITAYLNDHPQVKFIPLSKNAGNCKAFNTGWQAASGAYIIDLAADDLLLPERIAVGVKCFLASGPDFGVHFADARIIDRQGNLLSEHITGSFFDSGKVPEGYIFTDLLAKYFINPVTMMYSRALLEYLGGYDESLAYEDFDLWVRSAKKFKYCYTHKILVAKRQVDGSHGSSQYKPGSAILKSTLQVCYKALQLCETTGEYEALLTRIKYEKKMALLSFNWRVAWQFHRLQQQVAAAANAAIS